MYKKIICILLVIVMCFSLSACGKNNDTSSQYSDEAYWYSSGREISEDKPDVFYIIYGRKPKNLQFLG